MPLPNPYQPDPDTDFEREYVCSDCGETFTAHGEAFGDAGEAAMTGGGLRDDERVLCFLCDTENACGYCGERFSRRVHTVACAADCITCNRRDVPVDDEGRCQHCKPYVGTRS